MSGARDDAQAKRVGKAVVNSPLVKTAVHGGDPSGGRVAMAIGKCSDDTDIEQERVVIRFGAVEVYPPGRLAARSEDEVRVAVAAEMAGDEVVVGINLRIAEGAFTVYGCDLTEGTSG